MSSLGPPDSWSAQALYRDHHGWLLAWLRRRLACAHQAADLAHDTFVRILASRDVLLSIREPRAFLSTTASRLMIDHARRRAIEQAWLAELAAREVPAFPSPEQTLLAVEALMQISEVLRSVPPRPREAFVRHYLDGEAHADIAAALGVSTRMVRKYLAQVLVRCLVVAGPDAA